MANIGGVLEVIMVGAGFFFYSISEHSFYTRAIKKFYTAKTRDDKLFSTKRRSGSSNKDELQLGALDAKKPDQEGGILGLFTKHIRDS